MMLRGLEKRSGAQPSREGRAFFQPPVVVEEGKLWFQTPDLLPVLPFPGSEPCYLGLLKLQAYRGGCDYRNSFPTVHFSDGRLTLWNLGNVRRGPRS